MTSAPIKIEPKKLTITETRKQDREERRAASLRSNLVKRKQWQQAQENLVRSKNTLPVNENTPSQQSDQSQ